MSYSNYQTAGWVGIALKLLPVQRQTGFLELLKYQEKGQQQKRRAPLLPAKNFAFLNSEMIFYSID
jgi:hypothetical protein